MTKLAKYKYFLFNLKSSHELAHSMKSSSLPPTTTPFSLSLHCCLSPPFSFSLFIVVVPPPLPLSLVASPPPSSPPFSPSSPRSLSLYLFYSRLSFSSPTTFPSFFRKGSTVVEHVTPGHGVFSLIPTPGAPSLLVRSVSVQCDWLR